MVRTIHCYAEGRPGDWEAFCLDFDLAVQGSSFEDVYSELNESICLYLEYVSGLPVEERAAFIRRKSPLSVRFCFAWHVFRSLFIGNADTKERHKFMAPCPA